MIYSTPASKNWTTKKHNGVATLAENLGIEYIDLNTKKDLIGINWKEDTRDKGDHLNYTGSLKVTSFLSKYLSSKDLPDHRNDEQYKSWHKYYKKYEKKLEKD